MTNGRHYILTTAGFICEGNKTLLQLCIMLHPILPTFSCLAAGTASQKRQGHNQVKPSEASGSQRHAAARASVKEFSRPEQSFNGWTLSQRKQSWLTLFSLPFLKGLCVLIGGFRCSKYLKVGLDNVAEKRTMI